jgi:hypothetical protein
MFTVELERRNAVTGLTWALVVAIIALRYHQYDVVEFRVRRGKLPCVLSTHTDRRKLRSHLSFNNSGSSMCAYTQHVKGF